MKRYWAYFISSSRSRQIAISVLTAHLLFLVVLAIHHTAASHQLSKPKMLVRTARCIDREAAKTSSHSYDTVDSNLKKTERQAASHPHPKSKTGEIQDSLSGQESSVNENLLVKIMADLQKVLSSTETHRPSTSITVPKWVEMKEKQIENASPSVDSYREAVISLLEDQLDLPEFGEVIAHIDIHADGNVRSCEILNAQNRKNGEYIKKRLHELSFPCFNVFGLPESNVQFTVAFRNVENLHYTIRKK